MNNSSDFIDLNIAFDSIEPLHTDSRVIKAYKLRRGGSNYFMKVLPRELCDNSRYRSAFEKEYKCGSMVCNPHIVKYLQMQETGNGICILMEYVNGVTLSEKIATEPDYFNKTGNVERFLRQLLTALDALHKLEIIYLDINPGNIMFTKVNNNVKLIDLGFCLSNINDNTIGCTKGFVAPEVASKAVNEIDVRSDIYAVGCLLKYIEENASVKFSDKIRRIMNRCLQPDKKNRYVSAKDIIKEISAVRYQVALTVIAVLMALSAICYGFTKTPLYTEINRYIAWETGKMPARFEHEGIFYHITDPKQRTVEVTFKGNSPDEYEFEYKGGEIVIPPTVKYNGRTFKVTSVATYAFKNPYISKIIIPEGMLSIDKHAFSHCLLNGFVKIPKSVKRISPAAFEPMVYIDGFMVEKGNDVYDSRDNSYAIIETATNILLYGGNSTVIPNSVVGIAERAFAGSSMKSIDIPESVKSIGEMAFLHAKIEKLVIPEGVSIIEDYSFQYCENLWDVTIPQSVQRIEYAAFSHGAFQELIIPDGVTYIGEYAFDCCNNLKKLTIGENVAEIGNFAFENCSKLEAVYSHIPADKLFVISNTVFNAISKDCVLYVPRGAKAKYSNTIGWNNFSRIVETDM